MLQLTSSPQVDENRYIMGLVTLSKSKVIAFLNSVRGSCSCVRPIRLLGSKTCSIAPFSLIHRFLLTKYKMTLIKIKTYDNKAELAVF